MSIVWLHKQLPSQSTGGGTVQGTDNTHDIEPTNEGATAGNARGENSVDLCTLRSDAAYVTAGANCGAVGGENIGGTADGTHTFFAAGKNNYNNSGDYCNISGSNNYSNSGNYCNISGRYHYSNSGNYCNISGSDNYSNTGFYCSISGSWNHSNSGYKCNISGSFNYSNSGYNCNISGELNHDNSGNYCNISGFFNYSNSGNNCNISGYRNNANTGSYCSISGSENYSNSGNYCSISGFFNRSNSGNYCSISGIWNSTNTGSYCNISGHNANNNALSYARVHGGNWDARIIDLVAQITTSDANPTELLLGGSGGTRIIIPNQSAWNVDVRFVAKTNIGSNAAIQNFTGVLVRDGTTTTYAAGTSDAAITEIGTTNASFAVAADDTNEALKLTVTCSSGTVRASARIQLTQVDY